jgi:pimeloyl-ACP methyl ester carboxylesterase
MTTQRQNHIYQVDSDEFHYIDWGGNGPLTHFAHATGLCAGVYTKMVEDLLPHLKVVGCDFRGHGQTSAHADPSQLNNWNVFYDDLEGFFRYLGQPIVAIGHSLGGTVSLKVAACRPELVSALILIDPGIMPPSWRPWVYTAQKTGLFRFVPFVTRATNRKRTWPNYEAAWNDLKGKGPFRSWRDELLQAYITDGMVKHEDETIELACDPVWEGRCLAMAPYDIWRFVPRIKVPTLLLYGARSTTFVPSVVKRFRKDVPHAVIKECRETGHFVPMEHPNETAEIILNFIHDKGLF